MKVVNFVLGLGTALILGALIILGIKAFYPEPVAPNYPTIAPTVPIAPCASNDTQCEQSNAQIEAQQQDQQNQFNQQEDAYTAEMQIYNRNIFIIGNIIGMIVFAIGFWMLFATAVAAQSVPIGIMIAGLWAIIYGYGRGWGSVNDQLKFFIGLIIALLVIGGSMWLIQRYAQKREGHRPGRKS
jgi:heme/copper-type cytochrome/quinol oxidase subunit 4